MLKIPDRKVWTMCVALSFFLVVLILLAIRFFILVREGKRNPQIPAGSRPAPQKSSVNIDSTQTQVIPQGNLSLPTINYRDHKFTPLTTALEKNTKSTGCVIQVVNQSNAPLTIRLSPHEKALKGNYGGQYDPVLPGKSIIIDPRFDMGYESFHNFKIPSEEFHIRIGNSCRSDL